MTKTDLSDHKHKQAYYCHQDTSKHHNTHTDPGADGKACIHGAAGNEEVQVYHLHTAARKAVSRLSRRGWMQSSAGMMHSRGP